jgi:hypothetical protein
VLVDTPIWSYAFRSKNSGFENHVENLKALITEQRVVIIGAIRQEVLSGYSDLGKFETLKNKLGYFELSKLLIGITFKRLSFLIFAVKTGFRVHI